jgi:hypothetical protein
VVRRLRDFDAAFSACNNPIPALRNRSIPDWRNRSVLLVTLSARVGGGGGTFRFGCCCRTPTPLPTLVLLVVANGTVDLVLGEGLLPMGLTSRWTLALLPP